MPHTTIIQQDYYPLRRTEREPSPYSQGYQDWLAFGDAANALDCDAYAKGKADAKRQFFIAKAEGQ